ncbi:MAG: hypothetical protein AAFO75_08215, partial [Pseudomonadota bacterium]
MAGTCREDCLEVTRSIRSSVFDEDKQDVQLRNRTAGSGRHTSRNAQRTATRTGEALASRTQRPEAEETSRGAIGQLVHGVMRFAVLIVLPVVLLFAMAAGVAYFRLAQGPVDLAFLAPRIEKGINDTLQGYAVKVGHVVVALNNRSGFEVQLQDVSLRQSDGEILGKAPSAAVDLDHMDLLSGKITATRVDLIEPQLALSYTTGRGLSVTIDETAQAGTLRGSTSLSGAGNSDDDGTQTIPPNTGLPQSTKTIGNERAVDLNAILTALSQGGASDGSPGLSQLGFRDATVRLNLDGNRSVWRVPEMALNLEQRGE